MRRLYAAVAVSALLAGGLAVPGGAAEDHTPDHVVHAGAVPDDPLKPYAYLDYFPRDLKVHRGDRVRWEFPAVHADFSFHTVTFGDPDEVPMVRADELPGTFAWDERSFWTTGCGRPGQPVCVVSDPDELVSSGTPIQHFREEDDVVDIDPFDAVVDLPPGVYSYFCTIHHPMMQGTIEVVDDDVETDNPAPDDFADEIAQLTAEADALVAELSQPAPVDQGGQRVWTVHAGARTREVGGVGVVGFVPASLAVRPGDAVRWVADAEVHGVTFPDTGAHPAFACFTFGCELDEPDGGAPAVPVLGFAGFLGLPWCPPGASLELGMTPQGAEAHPAPGNAVVTAATYHNSGVLSPVGAPERMSGKPPRSGEHWPAGFDADFPAPGTYTYRCQIHFGVMGGSVTVETG